mgnify:CR=1 FL=1
MKKVIISLIFLLSTIGLYALSYSPDVTLSSGGTLTYFEPEIDSESRFRLGVNANAYLTPVAFVAGNDIRISFPIGVEYVSRTRVIERSFILPRLRYELDAKVDLFITNHIALSFATGVGLTHYYDTNGFNLYFAFETGPMIMLGNYVSMSIPVKAILAQNSVELEPRIAISVYPFKIKEEAKR